MVWRRIGDMSPNDKMMLDACKKFLKDQTIPDSRLCLESGDRYVLNLGKPLKDERVVNIWAREEHRPLAHVAFTLGGTAKRMVVFADADVVCYELNDAPELPDDAQTSFADIPMFDKDEKPLSTPRIERKERSAQPTLLRRRAEDLSEAGEDHERRDKGDITFLLISIGSAVMNLAATVDDLRGVVEQATVKQSEQGESKTPREKPADKQEAEPGV